MAQNKKRHFYDVISEEKNAYFQGFRVYDFALDLKSKTWKPPKVFIYFKSLSFPLH